MEMFMSKNLNLSYILFFVFSAILIAFKTLTSFFGGVAINIMALIALVFVVLTISFKDKELMKRIRDLFLIACAFCVLELVIYFACEFGYGETLLGFSVYQNIISFLGILFLAYIYFRYSMELLNKKIKFIEILLGNEKRSAKPKKAKELSNGCLEEKPNCKQENNEEKPNNEESEKEETIIIETEE